ncbi:MAG: hypothetical protein WC102_11065 [Saccharofermentanales bacterium]|jgi:hypothetical protein
MKTIDKETCALIIEKKSQLLQSLRTLDDRLSNGCTIAALATGSLIRGSLREKIDAFRREVGDDFFTEMCSDISILQRIVSDSEHALRKRLSNGPEWVKGCPDDVPWGSVFLAVIDWTHEPYYVLTKRKDTTHGAPISGEWMAYYEDYEGKRFSSRDIKAHIRLDNLVRHEEPCDKEDGE